ncbi:iron-siderophore ABC transporter substrate-binding protein [Actinophytocola algeriensis]|uniref:Iron complex transport system substrate-binding protein n=1 Tax=Actinophytocola algeriensis TaxID=1768010 RepID=A0A7W7Q1K4_9PSEU|nr:iron-siderophore ABC transporter substrate-binding protein [Actinophytocola algeriensis]MBB4905290.1 iron complex transport system substrate-binding protein [Actinophytocola algeriensis]MBE1473025.1 iron complex transport system substrate-binding protein [Actinophytocola algeriensis]
MRKLIATVLAAALLVSACGQVEETEEPRGATVKTMFGDVTVPADPKRVVALGWSDAETALALGVRPVAASDWLAFGGEGVGPWAEGRYDEPPVLLGTQELDYEQIFELKPDVILDTRSDNSKERFDELSKIAPTVAPPAGVVAYGTTWRQQLELVSTALGKEAEGDKLVKQVEDSFADVREQHPEFAGKSVAVGAYFSEKYGAYVRGDARADFMESIGFTLKPRIQELASGSFYIDLSREQVELLDADLTVVFPIGSDASAIKADRVLNQLPSAKAGHLVVLEDLNMINAFSSGSVLGTLYAIENTVPLFADAV